MAYSAVTKTQLPIICTPRTYFGVDYIDEDNSTYTESTPIPSTPISVSVASGHLVNNYTPSNITSSYDIQLRVADDGAGATLGPNAGQWIYKDGSEDWQGWQDYQTIHGVEQPTTSLPSNSTTPRMAWDKNGNRIVVWRDAGAVKASVSLVNTTTWTSLGTIISTTITGAASANEVDPDIVYDPTYDAFYCLFNTFSGANCSFGVAVSYDLGTTWTVLSTNVVPFAIGPEWSTTTKTFRRLRAIYEPLNEIFTVVIEYDDNVDEYLYQTTFDKTFVSQGFSSASVIQYSQHHDLVRNPYTNAHYLAYYNDSDATIHTITKTYSSFAFDTSSTTVDYVTPDPTSYSSNHKLTLFLHPDTQTRLLYVANGITVVNKITTSATIYDDTTINDWILSYSGGSIYNMSIYYYLDRFQLLGNIHGTSSSTYDKHAVLYTLGGFSNLKFDDWQTFLFPFDEPADAQDTGVTWTEADGGGSEVIGVTSDSTVPQIAYRTKASAGTEYVTNTGELGTSQDSLLFLTKVRVDSFSTNSTISNSGAYGFIKIKVWNGARLLEMWVRFAKAQIDWGYYKSATFTSLGSSSLTLTTPKYLLVAIDGSTTSNTAHHFTLWYSSNGSTFTRLVSTSLGVTHSSVDVTAAANEITWGVVGESATSNIIDVYWAGTQAHDSSVVSVYNQYANYSDYDNTYDQAIALDGIPLGTDTYLTKNLYVNSSGATVLDRETWNLVSTSLTPLANALINRNSPSSRQVWTQTNSTSASLRFDFGSEGYVLNRGFLYLDAVGVASVTVSGLRTSGGSQTIATHTLGQTITAAWARRGNEFYFTGTNSATKWYDADTLVGSYLKIGSNYYEIVRNTGGYTSGVQVGVPLRIQVSGNPSGESTSGSSGDISFIPKQLLLLWSNSDPMQYAYEYITVALTTISALSPFSVGTLHLGDYVVLPSLPSPGFSTSKTNRHERSFSNTGYSTGRRLAPSFRTKQFTFDVVDDYRKYTSGTDVYTNTVTLDSSTKALELADAHSTAQALFAIYESYGLEYPIVWVEGQSTSPDTTGNGTAIYYRDQTLYGYLNMETLQYTNAGGSGRYGNTINQITTTITEVV